MEQYIWLLTDPGRLQLLDCTWW